MRTVAVCQGVISMSWDQMGQQTVTTVRSGATTTVPVRALPLIITCVTSGLKTAEMISQIELMLFSIYNKVVK